MKTGMKATRLPVIKGQARVLRHKANKWGHGEPLPCPNGVECKRRDGLKEGETYQGREHTHTFLGEYEGKGYLERKDSGELVFHAPWLKTIKPFRETPAGKQLEPRARVEKAEKWIERTKKELSTSDKYANKAVGRPACEGYYIAATDGHRALLLPGDGEGPAWPSIGDKTGYVLGAMLGPEFHNAVKRADTVANDRTRAITISSSGDRRVTVKCKNFEGPDRTDFNGEFDETVDMNTEMQATFEIEFNVDYLESMCGVWPLKMYIKAEKPEENAVIFEPENGGFRFVVMPMK